MTYAWFRLRFSPPEIWIRQGLTLAMTRPSVRNQRPVRKRRGSASNSLMAPSSGTQSRIRAAVAAQIQADRRRRIMRNDSTVQILTFLTIRSKLSVRGGGLGFAQIVDVHAPADFGDGFAQAQGRQFVQRYVNALERSDVGYAVLVDVVPALLVESLRVAYFVDAVVAHLGIAEIVDAGAAVAGMDVQPEARGQIGYLPQRRGLDQAIRVRGIDLIRLGLDGARWGIPIALTGRARQRRH